MLYGKNLLEVMGLEVELLMILEVDNEGLVDIINSFSVGGRTRHIDIKPCFLSELKGSKQLIVRWISGSTNNANMFTKTAEMLLEVGALDMHKTSNPQVRGVSGGATSDLKCFEFVLGFLDETSEH